MSHRFVALQLAVDTATTLGPVLSRIEKRDRDLARQLRRAVSSVALCLAEGAERTGRDRSHLWRIAAGSAAEATVALELARAWGYLEPAALAAAEPLLDRLRAVLYRLTHARRP